MRPRRRFFRFPWRSRRQLRADLETELAFHLDMRADELVTLGLTREAARARAIREFGDIDDARRYIGAVDRDTEAAQRRSERMRDLWQDITYATRKLRAAPAFTIAAVLTLALGIGANTAIFSVVDRVLLQPLPFPNPDHLVRLRFRQQGHGDAGTPMDIVDYRAQSKDLAGISVIDGMTANLVRDNGDAERIQGARVSSNFFDLLRVNPLHGHFFRDGEDRLGAPNVVVLSEELWRRDFGGDESVIGRTVRINSAPYIVIGVAPAGRRYPLTVELWTPRQFTGQELSDDSRGARWGVSRTCEGRRGRRRRRQRSPQHLGSARASIPGGIPRAPGDAHDHPGLHRRRHAKAALHHSDGGRARASDCVRQRGEPAAGAGVGP